MFTLSRSHFRQFRAVLRRAGIAKQLGGFGQRLLLISLGDRCVLRAKSESVAVELSVQVSCEPGRVVLPLEVLTACEARSDDPVTIRRSSADQVLVGWTDQQIPQQRQYDFDAGDDLPSFPTRPEQLAENEPNLWSALRDAIASAEQSRTRYALDCIQLRGEQGQIIATDGRQVLRQSGFHLPWPDDVLVSALPVLGCRELSSNSPVLIGRDDDWVTFAIGDWAISLKIEKDLRFPRVDSIIPAQSAVTSRMHLAETDAGFLTSALPKLPSREQLNAPVTVDLNGHVAIRSRGEEQTQATELLLANSRLEGSPITWQTNRDFLARAVKLGFREICLSDPRAPAMCEDARRQFIWALLEPQGAIPASADTIRIESPGAGPTPRASRSRAPRSSNRMSRPQNQQHDSAKADHSESESSTITTLIEEAEALRATLRDATAKLSTLIAGLKRQRKQTRLMRSTLQSLKALQAIDA